MQPHQLRVVAEYEELLAKTLALGHFFDSTTYAKLDVAEQERLCRQWQVMQQYGLILSERIQAFQNKDS